MNFSGKDENIIVTTLMFKVIDWYVHTFGTNFIISFANFSGRKDYNSDSEI